MGAFNETNLVGGEFEKFNLKKVHEIGFSDAYIETHPIKRNWWDIWVNELIQLEVKNDVKGHHDSDNICIEIGQDIRKDNLFWNVSGIFKTKSTYWVHTNGISYPDAIIYLAHTDTLKRLVHAAKEFYLNHSSLISGVTDEDIKIAYKETINNRFLNKFGSDFFNDITKIDFRFENNVKQEDGVFKKMDLCLIPQTIFPKYCLEVAHKNEMTYKDLL